MKQVKIMGWRGVEGDFLFRRYWSSLKVLNPHVSADLTYMQGGKC